MLTVALTLIVLTIAVAGFYNYAVSRPKGFPPGPPRIPFFGSYLFMMMINFKHLHKAVLKFTEWYKSDIVGFYMGPYPIITVHNAEAVHDVLNREDFNGRPNLLLSQMRQPDFKIAGVFLNDGVVWKEQRRFVLRYMRDYGFGRRFDDLEFVMQEEVQNMLDLIRNGPKYEHEKPYVKEGGYRVLVPYFFNPFSANSDFHVMFNERPERKDQAKIWELVRLGMQSQRNGDDYGKMLSIMPWVRHVFPNWSAYNKLMESNMFIYKYFDDMVGRHIDTYDESCERNFIDVYIKEMKKAEKEGNKDTTFTRSNFVMSLIDFSFPAFTSMGIQLAFWAQYMLLYPEVQKKIQREIDEVVGTGRLPNLDDRQFMPFTEATTREILRIETIVASNIPHRAIRDTELMGYKVPENTVVMTSLYAVNHDKRIWGDPNTFRPERFLDEEGKLSLKRDVSVPFGTGKRLCAGETFSRNMLFLITAALCQNFNIVLGPNDKMPDLKTTLGGTSISPRDFWMQLEERV